MTAYNEQQPDEPIAMERPTTIRERLAKRASVRPREVVDVPEWEMTGENALTLQAMTGTQRDAYEAGVVGNRGGEDRVLNLRNLRARLVAYCLIDPTNGEPIYNPLNGNDIAELGSFNAAGLDRLFKKASVLNGITDADVKTLEKNLPAEANDGSGLSSQ